MRNTDQASKELVLVLGLLRNLLAIELWRAGVSQVEIGKRLGIATATVNKMLRGVSRKVYALVDNIK